MALLPFTIKNGDGFVDTGNATSLAPVKHIVGLVPVNFHQIAPICNTKLDVINFHNPVTAGVATLGLGRSPSAILGCVMAVIVNPVDRMFFGRPRSHVGIKMLKTLQPTVAYFNSFSAMAFIRMVFRIFASGFHRMPDGELSRFGQPVRRHLSRGDLSREAATTFRFSVQKNVAPNRFYFSALALAKPRRIMRLWVFLGRSTQHKKTSKFLAGKFNVFTHGYPLKFPTIRVYEMSWGKCQ